MEILNKTKYWPFIAIFLLSPMLAPHTARPEGGQDSGTKVEPNKIPEKYKVIIKGRILDEDKSPIEDMSILLTQVSDADLKTGTFYVTLRQGKTSKLWNPSAKTDANGKFVLVTDRRDWEETGRVIIHAKILRNLKNYEAILSSSAPATPIVITFDMKPERLPDIDLGDIVFRAK